MKHREIEQLGRSGDEQVQNGWHSVAAAHSEHRLEFESAILNAECQTLPGHRVQDVDKHDRDMRKPGHSPSGEVPGFTSKD